MMEKAIKKILAQHKQMVEQFETEGLKVIVEAVEVITKSLKQGGCVYICGNGGSAADAQHIAGELIGRFHKERKALAALALTTDTSVITSVANDYSYDKIFVRQVEALVKEGDILWAISTSGNSANVVLAAESARQKGANVIAFTGRRNCALEQVSDICLCAEAETSFQSQEIHQLAYHIICELVESNFCE